MVAAAPVLPVGYVVNAGRIADRRMILAGYRLAALSINHLVTLLKDELIFSIGGAQFPPF
jgi:hypothetical protein